MSSTEDIASRHPGEAGRSASTSLVIGAQLPEEAAIRLCSSIENVQVRGVSWADMDSDMGDSIDVLVVQPSYAAEVHEALKPMGWPYRLRWIQLLSAGIDGYPPWIFSGPPVASARGFNAVPVAEFALAAMLSYVKQIPDLWVSNATDWRDRSLKTVAGSTLGVFGFGAVGSALAERALALGMNVQVVRKSGTPLPEGVHRVSSIEQLFSTSDHVVLAAPLTNDTQKLVDKRLLAQARPGLHLINVARGGLVDEQALLDALDSGALGGATLDVLSQEPPATDHPLLRHPLVRISPHVAGRTEGVVEALAEILRENVDRDRRGLGLKNRVAVSLPRPTL
jgi:phosphoglycerate dehydrogenase-like enzyme